jgi:uncharacterized protein YndB with AHSA1/START domain
MTVENPGTVIITRRFDFSIERVFDAWLDPARASKFLFTTPTGKMVRVEIDARVGGSFNITRRDGEDVEHVGTYLEIDRPRRLVFTFGVPKFSAQMTRVSIDLKAPTNGMRIDADPRRSSTRVARAHARRLGKDYRRTCPRIWPRKPCPSY